VRAILVVVGLFALAAIVASRSGRFDPGPDTSVEILTTDPTVVRLARDRITEGTTGGRLVSSIRAGLFAAGEVAHERYHRAVAAETY
jgi:hypothetical protein